MSSSTLAAGLRSLRGKLAYQYRHDESDEKLLQAFTSCRDDSAFAVLVRRHGPMVLQVCRRVLGHLQDAEDAFQATFLVLARNAASLRDKTALASWLHGTAYRTALKAKQSAARRRKHEGCLGALTQPRSPADELLWSEVRVLLDEEIARLPENYRNVFVLCCLENMSQTEAGRRLGLKQRTVSHRLAEARERLSQQLARRGVELTVLLAATTLSAALPSELMAKTIAAGMATAAGEGLACVAPAVVAELVQGTMAATIASRAKSLTAVLLLVATSGSLVGWLGRTSGPLAATTEPPAAKADNKPKAAPSQGEAAKTVSVRGRVFDPDGRPASGARVYANPSRDVIYPDTGRVISTTTGKDGFFSLVVPRSKLIVPQLNIPRSTITIVATAKGYGPDWRGVPVGDLGKEVTLRMVKDDVPIHGRILSLEGKPLAGIRVSLREIEAFPESDLTRVLRAERNGTQIRNVTEPNWLWWSDTHPAPTTTTDADGRFRLDGIGRERIARLHLEGPRIHYSAIEVMTRKGESVRGPNQREPIHASTFEYLAKPARLIRGTVRERGTGKPIPGIRISGSETTASTTTDAQGRYELPGYAKAD